MTEKIDPEELHIVMSCDIDDDVAGDIINRVLTLNARYKKEKGRIGIYINSNGGTIHSAVAIINAMRSSRIPVDTYVIGSAESAALMIAAAGKKRYGWPNSQWMYHMSSAEISGTVEQIERLVGEMKHSQNVMEATLKEYTSIPDEIFEQSRHYVRDIYFTPAKALEYGIVDEIL